MGVNMNTNEYDNLKEQFRILFGLKPEHFFKPEYDKDFFDVEKFMSFIQASTTYQQEEDFLEFIGKRFGEESYNLTKQLIGGN